MLTLSIEFLAGRYHATSWEHHVNEGTVEWPPSPWRILRALIAASHKLQPALPPELLRPILEPLLLPPLYSVPPATTGHTRHYMPTDDKPTKVFDAFVAPGSRLEVHWPAAALGPDQLTLLDRVLSSMTYLGRAESWVDARRIPAPTTPFNCAPSPSGSIPLWAVEPEAAYQAWRHDFEAQQAQLPKKQRREAPADWWSVLHLDTGRLYKEGWSRPPGSRAVRYQLMPAAPPPRARSSQSAHPTVARFELSSAVLPRLTQALPVADRVRKALLKLSDAHLVFLGRDAEGNIGRDHHHAWFLPADDDADGVLDHLIVYARDGFDRDARRALEHLRHVWGHGGHDLDLALIGLGDPPDLGCTRCDPRAPSRAPQLGPAHVWESHTPFMPPRHAKVRGGVVRDTPEEQVARLLAAHGLPAPAIEPLSARDLSPPHPPTPIDWYRFRRLRFEGGGRRAGSTGYGFRLRFTEPVTGPIAIGYAAHQGLGQFVAIE